METKAIIPPIPAPVPPPPETPWEFINAANVPPAKAFQILVEQTGGVLVKLRDDGLPTNVVLNMAHTLLAKDMETNHISKARLKDLLAFAVVSLAFANMPQPERRIIVP